MEDISKMGSVVNDLIEKVMKATEVAVDEMSTELTEEVKKRTRIPPEAMEFDISMYKYRTPEQFLSYLSSIRKMETERNGKTVRGGTHSDYTVWWESQSRFIPFGVFIEWGTGPIGMRTNSFLHGYPYTIVSPWDNATTQQCNMFNEWGMSAQPHFYPALVAYKPKVRDKLELKIKENL